MPAVGEAIVLARREVLPPAAEVVAALRDGGLHVGWQGFGGAGESDLAGYVVPADDPAGQGFVSLSTSELSPTERDELAAHARALGSPAAEAIGAAEVSVRVTGTDGPELDWRAAYETALRTVAAGPGAVVYDVEADAFSGGAP